MRVSLDENTRPPQESNVAPTTPPPEGEGIPCREFGLLTAARGRNWAMRTRMIVSNSHSSLLETCPAAGFRSQVAARRRRGVVTNDRGLNC